MKLPSKELLDDDIETPDSFEDKKAFHKFLDMFVETKTFIGLEQNAMTFAESDPEHCLTKTIASDFMMGYIVGHWVAETEQLEKIYASTVPDSNIQ
jgi:hypothetical protein